MEDFLIEDKATEDQSDFCWCLGTGLETREDSLESEPREDTFPSKEQADPSVALLPLTHPLVKREADAHTLLPPVSMDNIISTYLSRCP